MRNCGPVCRRLQAFACEQMFVSRGFHVVIVIVVADLWRPWWNATGKRLGHALVMLLQPTGYASLPASLRTRHLPYLPVASTTAPGPFLESAALHPHAIWMLLLPVCLLMTSQTPLQLLVRDQGRHFSCTICN